MKFSAWKVALFSCCLLMLTPAVAQQIHFIYIQSDDKQPFAVAVNGKNYASSEAGYVIVPKLTNGTWPMTISFPGKQYPDQQFTCVVDNTDAGYALKNYGEKGWGLFNFQTLDIVMAGAAPVAKKQATADAFGDMLSEVTDDSTLQVVPPPAAVVVAPAAREADQPKKDIAVDPKAGQLTAVDAGNILPAATGVAVITSKDKAEQPIPQAGQVVPVALIKLSESTTPGGTTLVFLDTAGGAADTVRVFIPGSTGNITVAKDSAKSVNAPAAAVVAVPDASKTVVTEVQPVADAANGNTVRNPFYSKQEAKEPPVQQNVNEKSTVVNNTAATVTVAAADVTAMAAPKQDCKKMLSAGEFEKIKHKMFLSSNDTKMTDAALKGFSNKCVTVQQLKDLGILYPSDESRFNFFAAALPFVADPATFASLQSQLIDPVYKKRLSDITR